MDGEALVRDYLGRLEAAAWPLSADRKGELVGEVREHIEAALVEAGARDEVTVRNVLERLGRPEDIVAEEAGAAPAVGVTSAAQGSAQQGGSLLGAVEILGLLFLTVGSLLLPIFGPVIGIVFVAASTRWTTREKVIAAVLLVSLFSLAPILATVASAFRIGSGVI